MTNLFENFPEQVAMATVLVATLGIAGSAVVQFIKQAIDAVSAGKLVLPAKITSTLSGIISAGLSAFALAAQGTHWLIAVLACMVALYVPSLAHDYAGYISAMRLKNTKKKK